MKSISDIVLSFVNVVEAEGKLLREKTVDAGKSVVCLFFGGLCIFAALAIGAIAVFAWLEPLYGKVTAELIIAAAFLVLGIVLLAKGGKR